MDVREERPGELVRRFTEATGAVRVEAFGAIYARYERVVVLYCRRLTWPDTEMALDAAQETFIAAWSGLAKLENPDAFGTWLRTIARRQCLRLLKERDAQLIDDLGAQGIQRDAPSGSLATSSRRPAASLMVARSTKAPGAAIREAAAGTTAVPSPTPLHPGTVASNR